MKLKDRSQYKQFGFISDFFNHNTSGRYVDCGTLDGIRHSNTYNLEKELGWSGVLVEASENFYNKAKKNRSSRNLFFNKALYHTSGLKLRFREIDWNIAPGLSGLEKSYSVENLKRIAEESENHQRKSYEVETITLDDVLSISRFSRFFELLKLDLEGGEFDALSGFDIQYWKPKLICCELSKANKNLVDIKSFFLNNSYQQFARLGNDFFFKSS